ncbi:MAG: transposase [Candidatus Omnitrophota bacterium]|jgi:putative transposase
MPRTRRIIPIEEAALHIVCRGNNRQRIFYDDGDKLKYYALLCELKHENGVDILNYCIMDNHVHSISYLRSENNLSKFMKQVNLSYFHYYKKKYGYCGHLWQNRFRSNIIEYDRYLLQCGKYIELNPVRAGMVNSPGEYLFSSYNYYSNGKPDSLVTTSPVYRGLSDSPSARQKNYINFVINGSIINSTVIAKNLYIGSPEFIAMYQERFKIKNPRIVKGRPPKESQEK